MCFQRILLLHTILWQNIKCLLYYWNWYNQEIWSNNTL